MFTKESEKNFLIENLNLNHRVLEWGSGSSTLLIAENVKEIISIEHQKKWFDTVNEKKTDNIKIYLKEPNLPYAEGGHDGTYEEFKDYCDFPLNLGYFDIILIDGRARVSCAYNCLKISHENTLIFIHDFNRVEYQEINNFLEKISCVDSMCLFKLKK